MLETKTIKQRLSCYKRKMMKIHIDKLDTLFSRFIRMRAGWKCERCGSTPDRRGLHCHHFHRRRKQSTRFDEDNGLSLCLGCHQFFGENREEEEEFMLRKLGQERYDMLSCRARTIQKVDREIVRLYFEQRIKELEAGNENTRF